MLPELSTVWSGRLTKLPELLFDSSGMNRPPGLASKMVTATTSPTPMRILAGPGPLNFPKPGAGRDCSTTRTTAGVTLTTACGAPDGWFTAA